MKHVFICLFFSLLDVYKEIISYPTIYDNTYQIELFYFTAFSFSFNSPILSLSETPAQVDLSTIASGFSLPNLRSAGISNTSLKSLNV